MKSLAFVLATAGCMSVGGSGAAIAQSQTASTSYVPRSAFYVGLGAGLNSVDFSNQNIFAQGVSDIFFNGALVASGSAGGPTTPTLGRQTGVSPTVQGGYFQHFSGSDWLWGGKFSYSALNSTATDQNVLIPQVGSFTGPTPDTFTGNVVVRSYQTTINHQFTFIPFIGRSFERSFVYFGVGPTLSQTRSSLNGVIGFAAINGVHENITGTPSNFSSTQWAVGGAASVGVTYFFDRSWFLDVSYSYAMTENRTENFSGPFASAASGYTDTGILSGNYSGKMITQSINVSINKAF
jgi:hypothetical protein